MQRMYSDNHWLSDTVLAASIGYFIGKAVVKFDDDASTTNFNSEPILCSRWNWSKLFIFTTLNKKED